MQIGSSAQKPAKATPAPAWIPGREERRHCAPQRLRDRGDEPGQGHVGAWGGVLLSGVVFTAAAPLGWIVLITIPGRAPPASMVTIFGKRQRRRTLEELAR